jgi:hypothetical protein
MNNRKKKKLCLGLAIVASSLAAISCTTVPGTQAPPAIMVPNLAKKPDIANTEAQVRKVEEKVGKVEDAVRTVGHKLDAARLTTEAIEKAVEEAYANGLEAGSAAADELRSFVIDLRVELDSSITAREAAVAALEEAKVSLGKAEQANLQLRSQIEAMSVQNETLVQRLEEANARIEIGIKIAAERDGAHEKAAKAEAERDEALKYKRAVWVVVGVAILYLVVKIIVATGSWTPQGRIVKTLF